MERNRMKKFEDFNRISLSNLYTPIENCNRLNEVIGNGRRIFIKRDDFIGNLVWGNKLRKIEYSLADAFNKNSNVIITWRCSI